MNPILLKVGIPLAIVAAIAFMRWTNSKATGEPFFPGVGDDSGKGKTAGGGAGQPATMHSADEVQDTGTYDDGGYYDDSYTDDTTDTTDPLATDPNIGAYNLGPGAGGGTAGHGGLSVNTGGVVATPVVAQSTLLSNAASYTGGYQPYSPTPQTSPVANQFGGQGGGRVFAM